VVKLLIDTHALIWFAEDSPRLSRVAKNHFESGENVLHYSIASVWEMAIKHKLGKLELMLPLDAEFRQGLVEQGVAEVPVHFEHVLKTMSLPLHHRDPFDRLLVAQALVENCAIVSQDSVLDAYPIRRIW